MKTLHHDSLARAIIIIAGGVFLAEILVMVVLSLFPRTSVWLVFFLDAAFITLVLVVALNFFILHPLRATIQEYIQINSQLQLLISAVEATVDGVLITDKAGIIVWVNPAYLTMSGYERRDLIGQNVRLLNSGKHPPELFSQMWTAILASQTWSGELTNRRKDGGQYFVELTITPVRDEEQQVSHFIAINHDVSARKQAQKRQQASDRRFRSLVEQSNDGIILVDESGEIIEWNRGQEALTGYAAEDWLERPVWEFLYASAPPEQKNGNDTENLRRMILELTGAGQPPAWSNQVFERDFITGRGARRVMQITIFTIQTEAGYWVGMISRDVTDRKRAMQALEAERARLYALLDELPAYVVLQTPGQMISFANRLFRERFGEPDALPALNTLQGRQLPEAAYPPDQVLATSQPVEWEWQAPDGLSYQAYDYPFTDVDGTSLVLELGIDISARKQAEAQLERRNLELIALSQAEHAQRLLAEGLVRSALALNTSLDLNQVFRHLLEQVRHAMPSRVAAVVMIEGDSITFPSLLGLEDNPELLAKIASPIPLAVFPLLSDWLAEARPLVIADLQAEALWQAPPELDWLRAIAITPLNVANHHLGLLSVVSDQPGLYDQTSLDRLQAFAAQAAVAISNARLYQAEQAARQTAETLRVAGQALSQSLDLKTVLVTLLDYLARIVPYDSARVYMLEDEGRLVVRAARGYEKWFDPDRLLDTSVDLDTIPYLQSIFTVSESLLIPDTAEFPGWAYPPAGVPVRSWLGVPLVVNQRVLGLCCLDRTSALAFSAEQAQLAELLTGQAAMAVQNAWLFDQVRAGRERLQVLSRRLVEIQETERSYIARELHDEAGQALTSLMLGLRLLERQADQPANLAARVAELKCLVEGVLENLHRLAVDLRPASLDHLGLVAALRQHVETVGEKYGLMVQFEVVGLDFRLPADLETALYRIVQEGLTNVIRHSKATQVAVLLERRDDRVVTIVEDNGIGFDLLEVEHKGRLGLFGLRERAEMFGGSLVIESAPGAGTALIVEVPNADPNLNR